jgi:hypothetical protein
LLFGTILLIPRLRRLRRRVWSWTCVRLALATCGGWLVWRFVQGRPGAVTLVLGLLLMGIALLVRAQPPRKSVDALAIERHALIVLHGGIYRGPTAATPVSKAQIFVHPDRIIVLGPRERPLLDIPWSQVQNLAAHPVNRQNGRGAESWEVEILWMAEACGAATFQYEGAFAEHLARVAEATLRSQWKRDLPVLPR